MRFGQFEQGRNSEIENAVGNENQSGKEDGVTRSDEKFDAPGDSRTQESREPEF